MFINIRISKAFDLTIVPFKTNQDAVLGLFRDIKNEKIGGEDKYVHNNLLK